MTESLPEIARNNLFINKNEGEFYVWIDAKNPIIFHNIVLTGHICSVQNPAMDNLEDNLLFIPNPKYKGSISPYHNNIVRKLRTEYILEDYRPKQYPSRMHALYLCQTKEEAEEYKNIHPKHVEGRILISGTANSNNHYSLHDSGWFDFLCKDTIIDQQLSIDCARHYWAGIKIVEVKLNVYGSPWSQPPTMEVLYYGGLKISEESIAKVKEHYMDAYSQAPHQYPPMHFSPSILSA